MVHKIISVWYSNLNSVALLDFQYSTPQAPYQGRYNDFAIPIIDTYFTQNIFSSLSTTVI